MNAVNTPVDTTRDGKQDKSRVILVTGATGGLGSALCKALASLGVTVILSGRKLAELEKLYDKIEDLGKTEPAMYPLDLAGATDAEYRQLAETIGSEFHRLDGIAHCAADLGVSTPLEGYPVQKWQAVMRTNCDGPFMLTRACLPLMMKTSNASITFTVDHRDSAFWGAYGVSKSAATTLMSILADETEGFKDAKGISKVAVNAIHPGRMRTKLRAIAYSGELPEESPLPKERVSGYLDILLRKNPALTGHITYLDPADAQPHQVPVNSG